MSEAIQPLVDQLAATLQARAQRRDPERLAAPAEAIAREFGVSRTPSAGASAAPGARNRASRAQLRRDRARPDARAPRGVRGARGLEGLAAELAATRILDDQLGRLHEAQRLFRRSIETLIARRRRGRGRTRWDDDSDWVRGNDLFHQVIQEAAANGLLLRTIADHTAASRALTWAALSESSALLDENVRQHDGILEAIEARDPLVSRRRMVEHVRSAGELIAHRFERSVGEA